MTWQMLSPYQFVSARKAGGLAALVVTVVLSGGCSRKPAVPAQPSAARSDSTESVGQAARAITKTPEGNGIRLLGIACTEFDDIVGKIGITEKAKMLGAVVDTLSEGHRRPPRSAKVETRTSGGFEARGTVGSGERACVVATFYDGEEIKFVSASDGSNAKIVSALTDAAAKVYGDLLLPSSGVTVPKGTVLRRQEQAWVAITDSAVEKRLDTLK